MPRAVGVVCEDAGAAQALAPVLAALAARGDRVIAVLGPVAARVLGALPASTTAVIAATEDEATAALGALDWEGLCVLLTGSTPWGARSEARAVLRARAEGVPVATAALWRTLRLFRARGYVTRYS